MLIPQPIPAFNDNYIWMLANPAARSAVVVDPGEAEPVLKALHLENLSLSTIFLTHHHFDHSGGALELREKTGARILGPNSVLFPNALRLEEGQIITLPEIGISFRVLEIPGHTLDHIALVSNVLPREQTLLFCGDTLFTGGCGRVFEGTAPEMLQSLQKLKQRDPNTLVYCGHEYTEANLTFAKVVEPENFVLQKRIEEVSLKRKALEPTVPSILREELNTNPFLRTDKESVREAAEQYSGRRLASEVEVFAVIREWKNNFSV